MTSQILPATSPHSSSSITSLSIPSQSSSKSSANVHADKPLKCIYCGKGYVYDKSRSSHEKNCLSNPAVGRALLTESTSTDDSIPLNPNDHSVAKSLQKPTVDLNNADNDDINFLFGDFIDEPDFDPDIEEQVVCDLNNLIQQKNAPCYLDQIKQFPDQSKFNILHLNINSIQSKLSQIGTIFDLGSFDFFCLNETKLDNKVPLAFYNHRHYNIIRRDRDFGGVTSKGGGILAFIKKGYKYKSNYSPNLEFMSINIKHQSETH